LGNNGNNEEIEGKLKKRREATKKFGATTEDTYTFRQITGNVKNKQRNHEETKHAQNQ